MRLSVLALFIALPAAAYAAVTPQQGKPAASGDQKVPIDSCIPDFGPCGNGGTCCGSFVCTPNQAKPDTLVCFVAHLLWLTLGTKLNADM